MQQENKYQMLPAEDAVQNWFEENIDKECSASSAVYKFRLWLESLQVAQHPVSPVWPLCVVDKATGTRHEVNKLVYHPENEPVPHVWCDTWYGHHVIGKDCEWATDEAGQSKKESSEQEVAGAVYELKLSLRTLLKVFRNVARTEIQQKYYDQADKMLSKHFNVQDILRTETGQSNKDAVYWIDVNDRLPEEGGRYWCYVEHLSDFGLSHFQWNCYYIPNLHRFSDRTLTDGERVTHWMPLPDPPQLTKQSL